MSISSVWLFIKSKAGQILAAILGLAALFLRIRWLEQQRDKAQRNADIAESEAKVERATFKINRAVQEERAAAAREQQAKVDREQAEAEADGRRRDIGGGW